MDDKAKIKQLETQVSTLKTAVDRLHRLLVAVDRKCSKGIEMTRRNEEIVRRTDDKINRIVKK